MWRRSSKNALESINTLTCHLKNSFLSLPLVGWLSIIITTYIKLRHMIWIRKSIKVNMRGLRDWRRGHKNSFLNR